MLVWVSQYEVVNAVSESVSHARESMVVGFGQSVRVVASIRVWFGELSGSGSECVGQPVLCVVM